jgi:plasmid replication initiation protein
MFKGENRMKNNDVVVYKNEMNTVPLRDFNSKEMDLFFSICSRMRDKGAERVSFTFDQLKDLSDYKMTATSHFVKDLESTFGKLLKLDYKIKTESGTIGFVLFPEYEIKESEEVVEVQTSKRLEYILNKIIDNFTKFELEEFTELRSSYSKTAYRLLKQYRRTGYLIMQIDEFKRLFDVPKSYQMSDIDKRILNRIQDELPKYFDNLKIKKIRGKGKRKRYIEHIEFKFDPETDLKNHSKTFRDEDGNYYDRRLEDFTEEEIKKTFPDTSPMSD